jgi:DNA-binding sugar fermentation-stimulating protein
LKRNRCCASCSPPAICQTYQDRGSTQIDLVQTPPTVEREIRFHDSRTQITRDCQKVPIYISILRGVSCCFEVKNCHLSRGGGLAEFPDCVAARSSRHLRELAAMVRAGDRAVVLFVVQRTDCDRFEACAELDPVFAQTLGEAAEAGVEVLVYACAIDERKVALQRRIPWSSER